MPQSEMITLAHWEGKKNKIIIIIIIKNTGQRAKSAARPPGNVPVLPMASLRLLIMIMITSKNDHIYTEKNTDVKVKGI